jgi:hypothetical protein
MDMKSTSHRTPPTFLIQHIHDARRIFFAGCSIGKWIDTDGDGSY